MPDTTTPTAAPTVTPDALRIVLFGLPAAGKSSLLGALAEAAQSQEHLLHGRLADLSHGLDELRHRLYDESPRRTVEEVVPYPIRFEPFGDNRLDGRAEGLLIDCDGRIANDLLVRRKTLDPNSPEGTLAREVLQADTLVLVIDASSPVAQVDADFQEFGRFLRLLERNRGERTEVGGLPVFLVLTKCDLLAGPADTTLTWMEHIEERKRQVDRRFQDFLARRAAAEGPLPFGRIDLHLWATAVKRPTLADSPAKPREPYGIAELFRQCLQAARDFRQRTRRSGQRLMWTVGGAGGFVALLLAVAIWFVVRPNNIAEPSPLERKVDAVLSEYGSTVAERLQGSPEQIDQRVGVLREIVGDPDFDKLSTDKRNDVQERLKELQEYEAYYRRLLESRRPGDANSLSDLKQIEDTLKTTLALPHPEWSETRASRLRQERLNDVASLRKAIEEGAIWYRDELGKRGEDLWTLKGRQPGGGKSIAWSKWQEDVGRLLQEAESGHPRGPEWPKWRETVQRFPEVLEARADWERRRDQLRLLRNLTAALGLGHVTGRPPSLVFDPDRFKIADARARLQELRKEYPKVEEEFRLDKLSETARPDIRQAAQTSYDNLLPSGQDVVLAQINDAGANDPKKPQNRLKVQQWLAQKPAELADWRILATALRRLCDPEATELDPVTELVTFLGRESFDIKPARLRLTIPRDLKVEPRGNLVINYETEGKESKVTLEPFGLGEPNPQSPHDDLHLPRDRR